MINSLRYSLSSVLIFALLVTACSTINVKAAWKNPSYASHPKKIMVIGLSKTTAIRRIFEDEFVLHLKDLGADAVASYTVLPEMDEKNHTAIDEKVMELGIDTVLLTRLASTKTVKVHIPGTSFVAPPSYNKWRTYYDSNYQYIYQPGYIAEEQYALIESIMYDAASDDLIWAAWSEAGITNSSQSIIKSYIHAMVKVMVDQNLFDK